MAAIKKSKKGKTIAAICVVLVIAILAGVITVVAQNGKKPSVSLYTIGTNDIYETVNATGEISSGAVKEYKVGTVAVVKEVLVNVGDEVKQGDMLATFDTTSIDAQVKNLQSSYNQAKASYNETQASTNEASKNLAEVRKQIKSLEEEAQRVENSLANPTATTRRQYTTRPTTTRPSTEPSERPTRTTSTTTTTERVTYPSTVDGISDALTDLVSTITSLSDDIKTTNEITRVVMSAIAEEIQNGNLSSEAIAQAAGDAMAQAIRDGLIEETQLIIDSGLAVQMVETAVAGVDWAAIGSSFANSDNINLTSIELRLAAYYAQEQLYSVQSSKDILNAKKEVMDTAKDALDSVKEAQSQLAAGWTAAFDGTITACDIYAGEQISVLSGGMTLQNMENKVVTISLGEYDIKKIDVGMPASISTVYGKYTGNVISKAPVATGGSSASILDSVGSMAGISGLSSLTDQGAGVQVQISVDNPDEDIIIGFDADVEISVGEHTGVVTVPIESIILEKTGTYVYLYNEEEKTVTKTRIETGAISSSEYEVTSGLNVGDKIISAPQSTYTEDTFEVKVSDASKGK